MAARVNEIALAHRAGESGFATCSALAGMMDDVIRKAYDASARSGERIAVLALGGYGRAELCPKSDVDVMILAGAGDHKALAEQAAKQLLHVLWDAGLDVGHSVRTVEEGIAQHGQAIESWASMLECRLVCGDQSLAQEFFDAMGRRVAAGNDAWFIEGVFEEVRLRHERFGNSVKLLEPNLKKSAGGLRDFHAIFWLYRANDPAYFFRIDPAVPASKSFLDGLMRNGVLDASEHAIVLSALEFILRARHEMHFRRQIAADSMEYSVQREVAETLGYGPLADMHSVEVFMREYYLHARVIFRLFQNLSHRFQEMTERRRSSSHVPEPLNEKLVRIDDAIAAAAAAQQLGSACDVLEVFAISAEHELEIDAGLRRVLANSAACFNDEQRRSSDAALMFRRILNSRRVAKTLADMNELDLLSAYIPEFGRLVAFFQHNVYHYFTADEHTLIAIGNAERLREQSNVLHEVFRNLRRKDVLYLALLLHDIGKPRGVADHEITGVEIARDVLDRLGMQRDFDDISFLIRNHLVMEQVAFRRNIHDPATIKEFAARFAKPELLDYLYLLTFADLSAVNTNVWTGWKASLLQELYQLTSEVLRRDLKGVQIDQFRQLRHEETVDALVERLSESMSREDVHAHLNGIQSEAYVALFTDDEIEEHIRKIGSEETVSTMFSHQEGHTEVTVIADDAPFALSKFCAVLSANDANIFDANVFTREDGVIIDRFRVSDASTKGELSHDVCVKIAKDLNDVLEGRIDIAHLFAAHRRKWKRRQRHPVNPHTRTDVQFEDNPTYTIIDVYAPDSLGFLYRITETMSKLGLDIYFAKIATRVDGILDAFYVLDRNGGRITDPERQQVIRADILEAVKQLSEQELSEASN
ncbi:MAG: [protein-PII] uridylyltransferase [Ignavibacteriae bacterium]|nr:[protein-PII] uridylyltransferase [Ignavibacteriota bacterium]